VRTARQVSISDFLTLFSSRTTGFFWSSRPGGLLLGAALFSLSLSTLLACAWPATVLHPRIPVLGLARGGPDRWWPLPVWIYCLVWCAALGLVPFDCQRDYNCATEWGE